MLGHGSHPQCWVTMHTPMLGHDAHQRPGIRVGTGDPDSDPHASPKLALQPSSHWFLPLLPMALLLTFASSEMFIKVFSQSETASCRACLECTVQPKQTDHISQYPCGDFYSMCVCDVVISVLIFSNLIETVYVINIFLDRETSPPMIQTPYGNRFPFSGK